MVELTENQIIKNPLGKKMKEPRLDFFVQI